MPSSERLWLSCFDQIGELIVEELEPGDEGEVLLLDDLDLGDHHVDRVADRVEVRVDLRELLLGLGDLAAHVRLHGGDLGDRGLLVGDLLCKRRLLRLGIGELVRLDRGDAVRGRRAKHAEQHRHQEKEGEPTEPLAAWTDARRRPAIERRGAAHQVGVVIVRADSVLSRIHGRGWRLSPPVLRRPEMGTPQDDAGLSGSYLGVSTLCQRHDIGDPYDGPTSTPGSTAPNLSRRPPRARPRAPRARPPGRLGPNIRPRNVRPGVGCLWAPAATEFAVSG